MKTHLLYLITFTIASIFLLSGCKESPTAAEGLSTADSLAANSNADEAYALMEDQMFFASNNSFSSAADYDRLNFTPANTKFKQALTANSKHGMANMGAALTEILGAYADPEINDAIKRWEKFEPGQQQGMFRFKLPTSTNDMSVPLAMLGTNFITSIQKAMVDPPAVSEMQRILRDKFLPRVDYAIARLAVVEQIPNYEMRISGKLQGDTKLKPVYADLTEIYILDGMLYGLKAAIEELLVFKFELADYTTRSIVTAIRQNNTTFFVLASDGRTRAANAKGAIGTMISRFKSSVQFLKSETDTQDDDVIKIGNDGISAADLDTVLTYLDKASNSLNSVISLFVKDADSDNNDYTIKINLGKLFDNLPDNPKLAWIPPYTVDTTAQGDIQLKFTQQTYDAFTFPDPTMGGIFPEMTNEVLKRLLFIDEEFSWRLEISLSDNNNSFSSSTTMKLLINGKTYTPKPLDNNSYYSSYAYFEFYILDNDTQPVQQVTAVVNGQDIPITLAKPMQVRLKNYDYLSADITRAPQNIAGQLLTSPYRSQLSFNQYAVFQIERATGAGAFVKIDSLYTYSYTDNNVALHTTYQYRALRTTGYNYYYYYGNYGYRANNYTNTVTVQVP
jgi:hypothetical protein